MNSPIKILRLFLFLEPDCNRANSKKKKKGKAKKTMGRDTLLTSYQNRIWYKIIVIKSVSDRIWDKLMTSNSRVISKSTKGCNLNHGGKNCAKHC